VHRLTVTSRLDAPASVVWAAALEPATFVFVARRMLRYRPAEGHRGPWRAGDDLRGWTLAFGALPLSRHRLVVDLVDHDEFVLVTSEGGGLVRSWRHRISVRPVDAASCRYRDEVVIDAGRATGPVTFLAAAFFRHRHRRWRQLAPVLAALDVDS